MLRPRVIPCLLISKAGLVKTVEFRDPKYVGDPINAVKIFNEKEADEIIVLDIDATTEGREPDERHIAQFALECRMPLCYGGGIRTVEQAERIVGLGVEKIAISASFAERPELVSSIAREIGSQSVVVVLDVKKDPATGEYVVWTHRGQRNTGRRAVDAAIEAESRGAGEIVVNSIERDGKMTGYDLDIAQQVRRAVRIPLTILGGAGSLKHMGELFDACGVVGAAAGSFFVFKGQYRAVLISYPSQSARDELFGRVMA